MNDQKKVKSEHDLPPQPKELAETKARLEAIIAAIGDPLVIIDKTYKIIFQNELSKELLGNNIGNYCYETPLKEISSCGECAVTRAWETGLVERIETSWLSPTGKQFLEIVSSPISDENGVIIGAIKILRDITNFKAKEQELQKVLAQVSKLSPILSICSHCKNIKGGKGDWFRFEEYLQEHLEVSFSHGICPTCLKKHYPEFPQDL